MKNFGKKFLASLLAVAQIITFTPVNNLTAFAADTTHDGNGTDDSDNISSTFSDGVLTISPIKENRFSCISNNSLWSDVKDDITKVVIEEGIDEIGAGLGNASGFGNSDANEACKNLTTVELPESLTHIGGYAFANCSKLKTINIPDSLTKIYNNAFENCTSLTRIDFSNCTAVEQLWCDDFKGCTNLEEVKLPSTIWSLSSSTFENCTSLTRIDLSNCTNLGNIEYADFKGCTNLEEVILPSTINGIGQIAFQDCSKLKTINIPDSLTNIYDSAFENCTSLTRLDLSNCTGLKELGGASFKGCTTLEEVILPSTIESFKAETFKNCSKLKTINIPDSVTEIGNSAFENDTALAHISLNKVKTIGQAAFCGSGLIEIDLPDSLTDIGITTFANCTSLTRSDLSNCTKLDKIPDDDFVGCTNLEEVILPNTIKVIGLRAFKDCSKLTTINIPDSLIYIDTSAFENDTALTNIDLNKVQTIKVQAFRGSGLTEIYLPDSLTHIEPRAFNMCNNLHKISGGKGIQDNLADSVTHNTIDPNYKHDGKDIFDVADYFCAQVSYSGSPLYPYPEDNFPYNSSSENKEMIYTNVDDAVDCIKYGNWRLAHRYQFRLRFIDATHTIFDTDKIFDGYTGYFDYYNDTVKAANTQTAISYVPVKYDKANAAFNHYFRDENYAVHTKDGKIYTPSDKWTKGKTGPEVDLTKDTQILEDIDYYLTKYDTDTVKHTVKFKNIKGRDTIEQTYNEGEHLTNIPTDLNYSNTNYNYTFVGWSTTYSEDNIVTVDETVTVTEDKEYYAIYERTDRITLKYVYTTMTNYYNIPLPECGNPFELDSTKFLKDIKSYDNVAVGQKLGSTYEDAPATLTKDNKNYDFVGWYAFYYTGNTDFKTITINADTEISKDNISMDRHDGNSIVYYAIYKYSPKKYKVSFINDECPSENKYGEVESGETYANTYNGIDDIDEYFVPSSNGKTFRGWKLNNTNEIVSTKDAIDRVITEDTTFTATFEDNIVNLTFKFFDADNTLIKTSTVMQLSTTFADIPKPDSNPTKDGYTFKGWRAESDIVKDTDVFSEDTDFYAVFEENAPEKVTARFIDYDDTELDSKEVTKGTTLGDITFIPSRQEDDEFTYTFKAWTVDNNEVTDDYVINEDTTIKATYTATPKQTTPVEPDPDVTITVTFKPENGEADTVKTDVVSGSALGTVKIADPVKAEDDKFTYTFAGWKVEENDAVVDDSYVINKDTVFIATYTATRKTYHVIFKDEDGTIIEEKDVPTNTPLGDIKPNDPR